MNNYDPEIFKFLDIHFLGNGVGAGYYMHSKLFEKYEVGNGYGCGSEGLVMGDGLLVNELIPNRAGDGYGDGSNPFTGVIPEIVHVQLDDFVVHILTEEMS